MTNFKNIKKESYLDDIIVSAGSIQGTIDGRIAKENAIASDIMALHDEFLIDECTFKVAIQQREAMLLNGVLYISESWYGLTDKQVKT